MCFIQTVVNSVKYPTFDFSIWVTEKVITYQYRHTIDYNLWTLSYDLTASSYRMAARANSIATQAHTVTSDDHFDCIPAIASDSPSGSPVGSKLSMKTAATTERLSAVTD